MVPFFFLGGGKVHSSNPLCLRASI